MGAKLQKDIDKCNYFRVFFHIILRNSKKLRIFAPAFGAQMAESVDALVSNTSGATRPGSTPGLGTSFKKQSSVGQVLTEDFCFWGVSVLRSYWRLDFSFKTIYSDWVPIRYLPPQMPRPLLT